MEIARNTVPEKITAKYTPSLEKHRLSQFFKIPTKKKNQLIRKPANEHKKVGSAKYRRTFRCNSLLQAADTVHVARSSEFTEGEVHEI